MQAVISISGKQFTVSAGDKLVLNSLFNEVGDTVTPDVLMTMDGGKVTLGSAPVELKVLEHKLGDKIRVYKMKAKKRYRRNKGHRQSLTVVEVTSVGGTKKAAKKAE